MPLARIAGRWTETDEEGRPLDPGAVLRRIQRQSERLATRGPEGVRELAEAKRRLMILASKKLGAWSSEPLGRRNPLDGTGLEKTRSAQAESWVNLLEARAVGDTGLAIRAVRELRNAIQLEAELRGEIASRSSVQAVQVNVTTGDERERTIERLKAKAAEGPDQAAIVAAMFPGAVVLEAKAEPATTGPTLEEQREELERLRRQNAQMRESHRIAAALAGGDEGESTGDEENAVKGQESESGPG